MAINLIYKLLKRSKQAALIPPQSPFYALMLFVLAFACAIYGHASGYKQPDLQQYTITVDKLDPSLDGLKIVHLADLHISALTDIRTIYHLVHRVNALKPDLILIPGDLIDGDVAHQRPIADLLFQLKAKFGVCITTGNHEYYSGYAQWRKYFEEGGLISLDNKVLTVLSPTGKPLFNLAGITDEEAAKYDLPEPNISGVISALNTKAPSILLSHRPKYANEIAASGKVDLILSGHTHGGLAVGFDRLIALGNDGYVSGLYPLKNGTKLIVSNGTLMALGLFPLRLGVPGQLIEITLRSKTSPKS